MPIAAITNQGLRVIAFLVAVLWGFIAANHLIVREANLEAARAVSELRRLRMEQGIQRSKQSPAPRPTTRGRLVGRA